MSLVKRSLKVQVLHRCVKWVWHERRQIVWDCFYQAALPALLLSAPPAHQASSLAPAAAERWQVENEPVGRAILSPLDTTMIMDTDWTASHSRPGISVWTVMSKKYEKPGSYYLFSLPVYSSTMSKNTPAEHFAVKDNGSTGFNVFCPIVSVTILYAYLTECSSSV